MYGMRDFLGYTLRTVYRLIDMLGHSTYSHAGALGSHSHASRSSVNRF